MQDRCSGDRLHLLIRKVVPLVVDDDEWNHPESGHSKDLHVTHRQVREARQFPSAYPTGGANREGSDCEEAAQVRSAGLSGLKATVSQ
jgi:hypothetical protein